MMLFCFFCLLGLLLGGLSGAGRVGKALASLFILIVVGWFTVLYISPLALVFVALAFVARAGSSHDQQHQRPFDRRI